MGGAPSITYDCPRTTWTSRWTGEPEPAPSNIGRMCIALNTVNDARDALVPTVGSSVDGSKRWRVASVCVYGKNNKVGHGVGEQFKSLRTCCRYRLNRRMANNDRICNRNDSIWKHNHTDDMETQRNRSTHNRRATNPIRWTLVTEIYVGAQGNSLSRRGQ